MTTATQVLTTSSVWSTGCFMQRKPQGGTRWCGQTPQLLAEEHPASQARFTRRIISRAPPTCATPAAAVDSVLGMPKTRSEEHTSELQSRGQLVCRLLLEKK